MSSFHLKYVKVLTTSQVQLSSAGCRLNGSWLLPPQLFFPCVLEIHHAVFESLDLALARSPVLVFSHALLHSIM